MPSKQKQKEYLEQLQKALNECQQSVIRAQKIVQEMQGKESEPLKREIDPAYFKVERYPTGEEIIEGYFDGEKMKGGDGSEYPVPENYASKSKLVEGDKLKLVITPQGRLIYKQICPVERESKRGVLMRHAEGDSYYVLAGGEKYQVLKASVTYYKGEVGDEAAIIVPSVIRSSWAALDIIVKPAPVVLREEKENEDPKSEERSNGDLQPESRAPRVLKTNSAFSGLEEI